MARRIGEHDIDGGHVHSAEGFLDGLREGAGECLNEVLFAQGWVPLEMNNP